MPYRLFVLIFTVCSFYLQAQGTDYHPTAIEGATWIVFNNTCIPAMPGGSVAYVMQGDSSVAGQTYKKLYTRKFFPGTEEIEEVNAPYALGHPQLYALIRDDLEARKVYGRVPITGQEGLSSDTLIHNYSAGVGDTLKGVYWDGEYVVDERSTEFLYGQLRRVTSAAYLGNTYVEGIGHRLLGPLTNDGFQICAMGYVGLIDYCIGEACDSRIVSSVTNRPNIDLECFPNPVHATLTIQGLQKLGADYTLKIHTLSGALLQTVTGNHLDERSLDLSDLRPGSYVLRAAGDKGVATVRFVKR